MSDTRAWTTTASIAAYDADWQKPARTEQYAYEQLVRHGAEGSSWFYVAFPWANLIDGHARGTALGVRLDEALARFEKPVGKKRIVTVCQHIKFRQYLELFERIGITDLFASHAEVGEKRIGTINIHPFPLYPVQAEQTNGAGTIDVAALLARPHLFSFVGAYNPKYYLTPVRSWIAELADTPGAHIVYRDQWHFEKRVYDNQVYGKSRTEADEKSEQAAADDFVELLKKTQFSLCPSGTGPNSIRLWESLEYGCIPVILADRLALPGDNDIWRRACVFVAETPEAVAAMPAELEALAGDPDRVAEKLAACAILRDRYGLKGFTTDLEAFLAWLDAEARATVGRHERDTTVYLDCALLDADAIAQWKTFLETACRNVERNLRIVLESPNRSDGCAPAASALDGHDWAREDLVVLSDSRPISRKLLKVFRKFYVRPSSAPTLVNIDLAVGRLVADDGAVSAPAPAECWLPICTLVSSTYDGDEYIRGFVDNCAAFERYPDIEHFIALANSPGHEVETLLAHTRANPAVVFVWMTWDPGLYEVWNYYCGLSTSRYASTSNIDDKRAPNHVRVVVDMLDEENGCDVGSTGLRIAKDPSITWDTSAGLTEWYVGGRRVHKHFDDLYRVRDGIVKSHNFPHCLPVWRTALMPVNGSFNEKDFGSSADWEYWLRAAQRGSVFAHLEEPLGLYYIAPASYWRRNPKAHQYEDNIRRKYFRSDLSHRPQEAQLAGSRVKDALAAHGDGRYLEAFLLLWQLACDLEMEALAGERLHTLVAFMATRYGIEDLEVLARGREWRDGRPSSELALCMSALVDAVHARPEMTEDACREIAQVAHDYFVRTTDVKGLVLLALLMRRRGRLNGEARLLDWSFAFAGRKLFGALSDVYRFTVPLADIVTQISTLPDFAGAPLFGQCRRLLFFPDYGAGNPYQRLFYGGLRAREIEVIGLSEGDHVRLFAGDLATGPGDIVHLHWLNAIFKNAAPEDHSALMERALDGVRKMQRRGVEVHWTIHNLYNHDIQDRALERRFRRELARTVDRVYVHHPALLAELDEWLDATGNISFIEHGSYLGVYPDTMSCEIARQRLGFAENDFVLAVVGQIREYKDLARYVPQIVEAMRGDSRIKLLVAGKVRCEKTRAALAEVPADRLKLVDRFIPDDEFDVYLNAASVVLLTYRHILTSGSLFQALSFGRPVLAPDIGSIPCYVSDYHNGFSYTEATFADRLRLFLRAGPQMLRQMSDNARATAESLSWPS